MKFDIPCVKNFLKENGFCFSVRSYNSKDSFVPVEGIGKCWRKKIKEVFFEIDLNKFVLFSGFDRPEHDERFYRGKWWQTIEKFCKGKPKYLYLVVRVE